MKYSIIYIVSIVVLGCSNPGESVSEKNRASERANFEMVPIQYELMASTVRCYGSIDVPPSSRADVSSLIGGSVSNLNLIEGQLVKKGQVLFRLYSNELIDLQEDYLSSKATLAFLSVNVDRQQQLAEKQAVSEKQLQEVMKEYDVLKSRVTAIYEKLSLLNISPNSISNSAIHRYVPVVAPIAGYVSDIEINNGGFLALQSKALTIINTDHLHLELKVFEKDVHGLKQGQSINFQLSGEESKIWKGEVYKVGQSINSDDRSVLVHGHFDEQPGLKVGAFVQADIVLKLDTVGCLPSSAVVNIDGTDFALIEDETTDVGYRQVVLDVGRKSEALVEVKDQSLTTKRFVKNVFDYIEE
ncbi:MAG: efflux RND transporter periplasmic adaptor subunit [Cyclobacteriaceae bacterium]